MPESNHKLTVRIAIATPESDHPARAGKTSLRWDRIILAALLLSGTGTLLAMTAKALWPAPAVDSTAAIVTEQAGAAAGTDLMPVAEDTEISTETIPENEVIRENRVGGTPTGDTIAGIANNPLAETPQDNFADSAESGPEDKSAAGIIPAGPEAADTGTDTGSAPVDIDRPALKAGDTRILSQQVTRFLITDGIRSLEPVGTIDDIALEDPDTGLLSVYAFSDVRGLRGRTLQYHWINGGKVKARVRVGVGSNRWRSSSSKILNSRMQGPWRVELRTGSGTLLAFSEFVY